MLVVARISVVFLDWACATVGFYPGKTAMFSVVSGALTFANRRADYLLDNNFGYIFLCGLDVVSYYGGKDRCRSAVRIELSF